MEQAAKATISLSPPSYAGCCMAACPYRSTRHLRRGGGCSARSISSLRHAPSARVYAAAAAAAAATPEPKSTKENDLVFIAGATGKVGSRAVRYTSSSSIRSSSRPASQSSLDRSVPGKIYSSMLITAETRTLVCACREFIKLGFRVRAGVRSAQRASSLVQVTIIHESCYQLHLCKCRSTVLFIYTS